MKKSCDYNQASVQTQAASQQLSKELSFTGIVTLLHPALENEAVTCYFSTRLIYPTVYLVQIIFPDCLELNLRTTRKQNNDMHKGS